MKKLLLLIFLVFFLTNANYAQDFGAVGTEWYYRWQKSGSLIYKHFESVKDTIIQGKVTHKIEEDRGLENLYVYQNGDTVFRYSFYQNKFHRFLYFNVTQGDTLIFDTDIVTGINSYRMMVDTTFFINIDGLTLQQYKVTAIDAFRYTPSSNEYICDRIGSLDYMFVSNGFTLGDISSPLRCFNDALIDTNYTTLPCNDVQYVSIQEPDILDNITLYPNPTQDIVTLSAAETTIVAVQLFDINGKEIEMNINPQNQFSMRSLTKGIYLLKIETMQGSITKKLVKN